MILVVTNSNDPTVDFVEKKFCELGVRYYRLNTDRFFTQMSHEVYLSDHLHADRVVIGDGSEMVPFWDITGIWYRRPVTPDLVAGLPSEQAKKYAGDEGHAYIKSLWKLLEGAYWVSTPQSISWAEVKLHQLKIARELGFKIPKSLATTNPDAVKAFYDMCHGKIITKPLKANVVEYGRETAVIYTSRVTPEDLKHVGQVRLAIAFFQEEIAKAYELRVTVIGDEVFVARIDSQEDVNRELDWRRTSTTQAVWKVGDAPEWLKEKCKLMVAHYGLKYGAFDFAVTPEDEYVFFELNPNGQWAWQEISLGYPMSKSLAKALGG